MTSSETLVLFSMNEMFFFILFCIIEWFHPIEINEENHFEILLNRSYKLKLMRKKKKSKNILVTKNENLTVEWSNTIDVIE